MKAWIETLIPPTPPPQKVILELTMPEAEILSELGNWHSYISKAATDRDCRLSSSDFDAVLFNVYNTLRVDLNIRLSKSKD